MTKGVSSKPADGTAVERRLALYSQGRPFRPAP